MKKPVFPRILGVFVLYCAVFVALVIMQFTQKGTFFSQTVGAMTISGQHRVSADQESPANTNEFFLTGGTLISFGGLEFNLKNRDDRLDNDGFVLINSDGERQPAVLERMVIVGDTARFLLPGGTELVFSSLHLGSGPELRISAIFDSGDSGLEIPFAPLRSAAAQNAEDGRLTVLYENTSYYFIGSALDGERLFLDKENCSVAYRAIPGQEAFNPADFAVTQAKTAQSFNEALGRWRDMSFSYWSRTRSDTARSDTARSDEETVIAWLGESLQRGSYQEAAASISAGVLPLNERSYRSSVYLGGMASALRSLAADEREKLNRISRSINQKSPDFFKESHAFEFLSIRGNTNSINAGMNFIRSLDPAALTLDSVPGILEGYMDLKQRRLQGDNPFERLIDRACQLVAEGIQKDIARDRVLVFLGDSAESAFNMRLGKALLIWAGNADNNAWAVLGRSLVLSALSLADNECAVPSALIRSGTGEIGEEGGGRLSAAGVYRILNPGEYYPRIAGIGGGASGNVWAWTAVLSISSAQNSEMMDILVTFPVNETHYMIIRGIQPIGRVQINDRNWPSDSQFERYDSSGWVYYAESQTLVLKMKHRDTAEQHIKIFFYKEEVKEAVIEETNEETEKSETP